VGGNDPEFDPWRHLDSSDFPQEILCCLSKMVVISCETSKSANKEQIQQKAQTGFAGAVAGCNRVSLLVMAKP
jgi:hypothetical protein